MKIAALIAFSFIAGWIGLVYGMVLGGLAVHASDFSLKDIDALALLCGIGAIFGFLGRAFGKKIGWIPAAVYCAPIALGGVLAGAFSRWQSTIAASTCVIVCAISFWVTNAWVAANKEPNQSPEPMPLKRHGSS